MHNQIPDHIQNVHEIFEMKAPRGIEAVEEMIDSIANEVTYAEMVQQMSATPDVNGINGVAEKYAYDNLMNLREQLVYAVAMLENFKANQAE